MCEHEFMELRDNLPQWVCQQCGSTLSAINTTKLAAVEQQLAAANNFAKLAGLAIIMRERLRGVHGISVEGPIGSVMKLVQAINDFDAEYARQFPTIREAQP